MTNLIHMFKHVSLLLGFFLVISCTEMVPRGQNAAGSNSSPTATSGCNSGSVGMDSGTDLSTDVSVGGNGGSVAMGGYGGVTIGGMSGSISTGGVTPTGGATGGTATGGSTGGMAAGGSLAGMGGNENVGGAAGTITVSRPSYNKSTGFYVFGNKLYDANNNEFRIRGVNHLHWDNQSKGIYKIGANSERWNVDFNSARGQAATYDLMQRSIGNKLIPMPANWDGTCKFDIPTLQSITDKWFVQLDMWKSLEKYLLLNIANEWGPEIGQNGSTVWRDGYLEAIAKIRAAGINATIVVDAGGCGQDAQTVLLYGKELLESDPQKNVIFDIHIYGGWQWAPDPAQWWFRDLRKMFQKLDETGLVVFIGEFGPGRNIGPSPTLITPEQVITTAELHSFGWMPWAWDDPAGEYTDHTIDNWFGMSFTGDYVTSADLTTFGKDVVENPVYGLKVLGQKASIFGN